MRTSLVLTVIGADRTGLVESIAQTVSAHGGNWVESRMARLAGQFAGILLVEAPASRREELAVALRELTGRNLQLIITGETQPAAPRAAQTEGTLTFTFLGHDRPGVVRDVSRLLAQRDVNVVELETQVVSAPMTGEPLFRAEVEAMLPEGVDAAALRSELEQVAEALSMDVTFD